MNLQTHINFDCGDALSDATIVTFLKHPNIEVVRQGIALLESLCEEDELVFKRIIGEVQITKWGLTLSTPFSEASHHPLLPLELLLLLARQNHPEVHLVQQLNLDDLAMDVLPSSVDSLVNLRGLSLDENPLVDLPDTLGRLPHLEHLSLMDTNIHQVPEVIGRCKHLKDLRMALNNLSELPSFVGRLSRLESLEMRMTGVRRLPPEICRLSHLKFLHCGAGRLEELPIEIGQLRSLEQLVLQGNRLTTLPESIGQLSQLKRLWLGGNPLLALPEELVQLKNLEKLYLLYPNATSEVPVLPEGLRALPATTTVVLHANHLDLIERASKMFSTVEIVDPEALF